ncbi:hypothetical protein V3H24_09480 [Vibrio parahaemolyticus]|uniref:hypothetical protein n=1 Tax=Vibrio parahaemolyticus TaxID=670 RepID=UPI003B67559F
MIKFKTITLFLMLFMSIGSAFSQTKNENYKGNYFPVVGPMPLVVDGILDDWDNKLSVSKVSYEKYDLSLQYTAYRRGWPRKDYIALGLKVKGDNPKFLADKIKFNLRYMSAPGNFVTYRECHRYGRKLSISIRKRCLEYGDIVEKKVAFNFDYISELDQFTISKDSLWDEARGHYNSVTGYQEASYYDGEYTYFEAIIPVPKASSGQKPYLTMLFSNALFSETYKGYAGQFRSVAQCGKFCPHPSGWVEPPKVGAVQISASLSAPGSSYSVAATTNLKEVAISTDAGVNTGTDPEAEMTLMIYNTDDLNAITEGPVSVFSGDIGLGVGIGGTYVQSLNSDVWGVGLSAGFVGLPDAQMGINTGVLINKFDTEAELINMIKMFNNPTAERCGLSVPWSFLKGKRVMIKSWGRVVNISHYNHVPACTADNAKPSEYNWDKWNTNNKNDIIVLDSLIYENGCYVSTTCCGYKYEVNKEHCKWPKNRPYEKSDPYIGLLEALHHGWLL